jgi:two-component system response regulator TctD
LIHCQFKPPTRRSIPETPVFTVILHHMRILLIEDHIELSRWLSKALQDAHLTVECALNGADADTLLLTQEYGLIILDLTLPKMDGLEVLKRMRSRGTKTPVLILTARTELSERVQGLNLGADDYMAKPFELAELEARVKGLLRRSQGGEAVTMVCGGLAFDTVSRLFHYCGSALALTPREHAVLEALIARAGQVVSKEKLFAKVFSLDDDANIDAIEIYIHRLRKKLERAEIGQRVSITTLRGLGYMLQRQEQA